MRVLLIIAALVLMTGCYRKAENDTPKKTTRIQAEATVAVNYRITERKDYSFGAENRMAYYLVFETAEMPTESEMLSTAKNLWKKQKYWDEFTVFMVGHPIKDFSNGAFAIAEFDNEGMKNWQINEYVLELSKL